MILRSRSWTLKVDLIVLGQGVVKDTTMDFLKNFLHIDV